jgi:dienelactone hydrolase
MGNISIKYRVFIVLSEFYGSNGWVRRVADRLAAAGLLALKCSYCKNGA